MTESEIYAIKRQYLGLLPPPQVIDICLTFEAHAPLHVKSTVWPYDIRAAIAAIQNTQPPPAQQSSPPVDAGDQSSPPKDLPLDTGEKFTAEHSQSTAPPSVTHGAASDSATPLPHTAAHPHPHPPQQQPPLPPPPVSHPHYPHQPYYHPSYPHAPYYPVPPPAHFSFPHPYPSFPHPPQTQYQQNIPPPPPPNHPPPLFTTAPLTHPSHPPESSPSNPVDDLPSYEEMIVEALIDSGDPEGRAPKALFSWMASHYPLQSNFRPSASQALQKAFKRGRLEKGNNGKYRLNSNWEGGNVSTALWFVLRLLNLLFTRLPRELLAVRRRTLRPLCLAIKDIHHHHLSLMFLSSMTQMQVHRHLSHVHQHKEDKLDILMALGFKGHPHLRLILTLRLVCWKYPRAKFERAATLGKRHKTFSKQ